jgi:hypothetical protein
LPVRWTNIMRSLNAPIAFGTVSMRREGANLCEHDRWNVYLPDLQWCLVSWPLWTFAIANADRRI